MATPKEGDRGASPAGAGALAEAFDEPVDEEEEHAAGDERGDRQPRRFDRECFGDELDGDDPEDDPGGQVEHEAELATRHVEELREDAAGEVRGCGEGAESEG